MRKQVIKLKLLIVFLMTVLIGLLALIGYIGIQLVRANLSNEEKNTISLGTNNRVGTIGVELHYDKEPVFISIQSPSGRIYDKPETDEEKKIMVIKTETEEKGEWTLTYNQKHNKAVSYRMLIEPSDKLLMDQDAFSAYIQDNKIVITCEPVYKEPTDTDIDIKTTYSVNMDGNLCVLDTRNIKANTISTEEFEMNEGIRDFVKNNDKITVNVATQNPDDFRDENMHSSNHFQISTKTTE